MVALWSFQNQVIGRQPTDVSPWAALERTKFRKGNHKKSKITMPNSQLSTDWLQHWTGRLTSQVPFPLDFSGAQDKALMGKLHDAFSLIILCT